MDWKDAFPRDRIYFETDDGILYNSNILEILRYFPDESIDCVVTSPPYWGLRDYGENTNLIWGGDPDCGHKWGNEIVVRERGTAGTDNTGNHSKRTPRQEEYKRIGRSCVKCGAWYGQLGLEPTFGMYLEHLWMIFDEIHRVLKPTGTLWVNLGDAYNGSGKAGKNPEYQSRHTEFGKPSKHKERFGIPTNLKGYPKKCLLMIPERFAIGMIDRGWILRNQIIWHKPNAMPESTKDRFTNDFEKIFFFVKRRKYYFKQILEPYSVNSKVENYNGRAIKNYERYMAQNPSDVKRRVIESMKRKGGRNKRSVWSINTKPFKDAHFAVFPPELPKTCIEAGCPESGVVLDPFMGSGTVAIVAEQLGRKWIGIEINHNYCEIAKRRIEEQIGWSERKLF